LCVVTGAGGTVCQVASGCRVVGDVCQKDTDCCGGPVGGPGAGNITCNIIPGTNPPIGTCSNPQSCDPEGDVCGGTGSGKVNARQDCCDCAPPKFNCCKPDSNGVYRCYGTPAGSGGNCKTGYTGVPPCCIAAGQQCAFSSECCDGTPCTPDGAGVLRCQPKAPTGPTCVKAGGTCTSTGDCCAGTVCDLASGALAGKCVVPPAAGTGGSGGSGGGGSAGTGGIPNTGGAAGSGGVAGIGGAGDLGGATSTGGVMGTGGGVATGGTGGSAVCGTTGATCTSALDCCQGLACLFTDGAAAGVCGPPPPPPPPPPICSLTGQGCLSNADCCAGLTCFGPGGTGLPCAAGQSGCSCYFFVP
jgi:hypothetical protein